MALSQPIAAEKVAKPAYKQRFNNGGLYAVPHLLLPPFSSFPLFHCQPDKEFWACQPSLCGKVGLIRYPFWSENIRPHYCGRPEFKLNCPQVKDKDDYPSIQIGSQTFNVTLFDLENHKMTLMRTEFVYDDCSSKYLSNTSVSTRFNVFQYDEPSVKNVTLFYNCASDYYSTVGFRFACHPPTSYDSNSNNYALWSEYLVNDPEFLDLIENCKPRIQVPVSIETDVEKLNGFGVKYKVSVHLLLLRWTSFS
ncbi:hypothetical protein K1719_030114 [Acacia pycnantha]|nr:hypothetical protein K1719_030114 [Acacia pycnantha]